MNTTRRKFLAMLSGAAAMLGLKNKSAAATADPKRTFKYEVGRPVGTFEIRIPEGYALIPGAEPGVLIGVPKELAIRWVSASRCGSIQTEQPNRIRSPFL